MKRLIYLFLITSGLTITNSVARAETYTITKTNDTTDGSCSSSDCSLREAISNQTNQTACAGEFLLWSGEITTKIFRVYKNGLR